MLNANKLKAKLVENDINVETFAKMIGISKDTMYRRINDGESFTLGEIDASISTLSLTIEDVNAIFFAQMFA